MCFEPGSLSVGVPASQTPPIKPTPQPTVGAYNKLHNAIYPPLSKYFWYRGGKVAPRRHKLLNTLVLTLVSAMASSGYVAGWVLYTAHKMGALIGVQAVWQSATGTAVMVLSSGISSSILYYLGASTLEQQFNHRQAAHPEHWKCQPTKILANHLHAEEVRWGCFNAWCAGAVGCAIFFAHLNSPFLLCHWDDSQSWVRFFADCLLVFFWIELWAYCAHRHPHNPTN